MLGYGFAPILRTLLALAALSIAGCGGSSSSTEVEPDPALAPFVGDWRASEFRVTSTRDSLVWFDVTDGGAFTLNIQPSGGYTAILEFPDLPNPVIEVGQMSVVSNSVTLRPQNGVAATSSYVFEGPDRLTLDGPTEFDFNADGELEEGEAHIVLERASG